ncbi:TY-Chap domain-containing protein [Nocardia transvalensis]|uniref:TY-Chap domain-containing protein n=1 Tax=Nocardia transvalensis TaxID=37333 RepID=UPI0018963585|nr:hypothetical protein [Nocardia transvalensis]MBF6332780.1 hypothetical protein [Nocardia transvalensis]
MTDWTEFSAGLAEELATLPAGALVVITEADKPAGNCRYTQFRQTDDLLEAQLTGDTYLSPESRPSGPGRQRIIDAGWQQPDSRHTDNWWIELPWPITTALYRQLADMVVTGLRDGFGITDPTTLVYDAWNDRAGNRRLPLPRLGLGWDRVQ